MKRKVILVVGLPGSGKTRYGERLWDQVGHNESAMWIDDPFPNKVETMDWALASPIQSILITDPTACTSSYDLVWERYAERFDRHFVLCCYENDVDSCWANLERRGDHKISRDALQRLSERYDPGKMLPDFMIKVWKP